MADDLEVVLPDRVLPQRRIQRGVLLGFLRARQPGPATLLSRQHGRVPDRAIQLEADPLADRTEVDEADVVTLRGGRWERRTGRRREHPAPKHGTGAHDAQSQELLSIDRLHRELLLSRDCVRAHDSAEYTFNE